MTKHHPAGTFDDVHVANVATQPKDLTGAAIERFTCPPGKTQAFLRDRKAPALRVRVTASGTKAFVFEAKLGRQTIRRTIGDVRSWSIDAARMEANRLRVQIDQGQDPRAVAREQEAERTRKVAREAAASITVGEVWAIYLEDRRPRWSELHYKDHIRKAQPGGMPSTRGTRGRGTTIAGPLYPLMEVKLSELTPLVFKRWAEKENRTRPASTHLCWRLMRGFLNWCMEQPQYAEVLPPQNPAQAKTVREVLSKPKVKRDSLQREQLAPWFAAVQGLGNPFAVAYLQVLLLTGARPGEVLALRWKDVNSRWKGLTLRDKVEGERTIPLTPYVAQLIEALPRLNEWVFASPSNDPALAKKAMSMPHKLHEKALTVAGIEELTLHGLRRSFKSLTEWLEIPAGVVAQIMGHKPSATAEKHYTVRPLDLLRMHHERIEAWILEQARTQLPPDTANPRKLRVVQ